MSLVSGTRLGRYEIRSKPGEGGMGEVYRAYDDKMNREAAIKVWPRFQQRRIASRDLNEKHEQPT